jgi:hypothetical protein
MVPLEPLKKHKCAMNIEASTKLAKPGDTANKLNKTGIVM